MHGPSSGAGVVAVLPAAGSGVRLGAGVPKAFVGLAGVPMLVRAVDGLLASDVVGHVVVVVPADQVDAAAAMLPGRPATVVAGGADRTASVAAGLAATGTDAEVVLVHDAARPLTPPDVVRRVVGAVRAGAPAVIPVLPVADTVKRVDGAGTVVSTVDRSELRAVQTPQGFRFDAILATGGDTMGALLQRISISSLVLSGEFEPGFPFGYGTMAGAATPLFLAMKAGGFGHPETLLHAAQRLLPPLPLECAR